MAKIKNIKLDYSFEVPDSWEQLSEDDIKRLNIAPTTTYLFVKRDGANILDKITVNTTPMEADKFEYNLISNVRALKNSLGPDASIYETDYSRDKEIRKIYIQCPIFNCVMYFTYLNNTFFNFGSIVHHENDNRDIEMLKIVQSLKSNGFS